MPKDEPPADALRAISLAAALVQSLNRCWQLASQLDELLTSPTANLDGLDSVAANWHEDARGAWWAARTLASQIETAGPALDDHAAVKRFLLRNARGKANG